MKASLPVGTPLAPSELIIVTGLSGSGKGTVLRALEDFGYYSVDNLPIDLIPKFAELTRDSPNIRRAALVVDVREGEVLRRFPKVLKKIKEQVPTTLLFLEAETPAIVRRFSETRRPHPMGGGHGVTKSIEAERTELKTIRRLADHIIDTSKLNVHDLKEMIRTKFQAPAKETQIVVHVTSFGYRNGVPADSDLVFDVRFLPNPNYIPEYKHRTGRDPHVARYIRSFPQTQEFVQRISELLIYLLPHYVREGKSYLTIAFGCTGGQHRSVYMADEIARMLKGQPFRVRTAHRDMPRERNRAKKASKQ
jgi:RNase adapter protein RapZ